MIDTKAIRSKILDLAIRGKLTEQLSEDVTAEELYQQIQEEKQALIQSGKIKKEKPLPEITEDEIPFEIPGSWKWVRLGDTFHVEMGQSPERTSVSKDGDGIEFHQGKIFFGDKYINDSKQRTNNPTKIAESNSVLLCVRAPVGKVNITQRRICIGRGLSAITPISAVELDYSYYYLVTCEKTLSDLGTGSTFSAINGDIIRNHLFPLPPLAEQKRIVEKIEQAFSVLDTIDELQAKYADNLTVLKSKLIDLAIRGKLTEQLPEDGTAEELYQQIQEEKQALIQSGKIKKEKPLPEIAETEIPFEIPENWKWSYLGDLFQHNTGKALNAKDTQGQMLEYITTSNLYWDHFELKELKKMPFTDEEAEKCTVKKGDLLVCEGGDIGRSAIWPYDYGMRIQNHIHRLRKFGDGICTKYYYYLLLLYKQTGRINGIGIGLQGFSSKRVHSLIVPLPPLAEQKRIVDRLDKLLAVCDEMR